MKNPFFFAAIVSMLAMCMHTAVCQEPFEVPLLATNGLDSPLTLHFGILPDAHFCIDESDCFNGRCEYTLPPGPPVNILDARFANPGGREPWCFEQGSYVDFRLFTAEGQRDTFRLRLQMGEGTMLLLSWPSGLSTYFSQLTLRYFDGTANVNINMLNDTTADLTPVGDLVETRIYATSRQTMHAANGESPTDYFLSQNYPNPFNPGTTIDYAIGSRGLVSLKVFDVLGREVGVLVNEIQEAGHKSLYFDTQGLASGTYVYVLHTGNFRDARKLLIIR